MFSPIDRDVSVQNDACLCKTLWITLHLRCIYIICIQKKGRGRGDQRQSNQEKGRTVETEIKWCKENNKSCLYMWQVFTHVSGFFYKFLHTSDRISKFTHLSYDAFPIPHFWKTEAETKWSPLRSRHFKCVFFNENFRILNKISLYSCSLGSNHMAALVQIMAWHRIGDKP